jgi:hypothetical protein
VFTKKIAVFSFFVSFLIEKIAASTRPRAPGALLSCS